MWGAHQGMGWWMAFGGFLWLVFLATIVWLLISVIAPGPRRGADSGGTVAGPEDAREIARQRYASGEINRDEFQQIMTDLDAS